MQTSPGFPKVQADLLLIHPPAFYDFRRRSDIYFPYMSTAGAVPITPLYEYFPVGFKTLHRYLSDRGHGVKIVNLATVLLKYPQTDMRAFVEALDVRLFGIGLHWMVHVQGSLEIAKLLKSIHPEVPVVFGGISSTYYAQELIRYPFIDMVMRGYETHGPVAGLLTALKQGVPPAGVPNLVWKNPAGEIVDNGFSHTPDSFACGVDWTSLPEASDKSLMPILELMSMQNAGCSYNCGWCGGSREAFRRIFGQTKAMARKPLDQVAYEFETMRQVSNLDSYHFYSVGSYNEPAERFRFFLERVAETNFESIAYEQFDLTPDETLKAMAKANPRTTICLSAESHDLRVAKLAGRGVYTMEQLERWIRKALDYGIHEVDIWFFIGMPEQDERSVLETVDYCGRLLKLFQGERVLPLLCPMIPFLDPASTFFERPEEHGYRVFYRTVEEHRRGMERASIINRCNYETRWLSRSDLVFGGYDAVRRLVELKGEFGSLPSRIAASVVEKITDALEWVSIVHQIDNIPDAGTRRSELEKVGPELLARNNEIFFAGVANQAMPVNREIGGRWFDELLQEHDVFLASASGAPPDAALSLRRPKRAGYPSGHHRRPHPRPA